MTKRDEFIAARPHVNLTTGEVIRMLRDLKGWTQAELAKKKRGQICRWLLLSFSSIFAN